MKRKIFIKTIIIFGIILLYIMVSPKKVNASIDKQTWRINPDCKIQEIPVESIKGSYYSRDYSWSFENDINSGWSGKTLYGGSIQGSTVTERHIIFAVIRGSSSPSGYIYVTNKTTGSIEQSIPVPYNGENNSVFGHMNDMTYNPNSKEVFLPIPSVSDDTGSVVIFKYNSNGSLNTTPTIVNQCEGCNCGNMAYNSTLDKYLFNAGDKIYIASRDRDGFKSQPEKIINFSWGDFRYMTSQSIETNGRYFYKIFTEDGVPTSRDYHDSEEQGSCIAAAYDIETGNFVKGIYISNKSVSGELEGISFDPTDGSMILAYNVNLIEEEQRYDNTAFYKLKAGNQILNDREQYFYNNGFVAPKAIITAEKYGIEDNLIRYYNGTNNLGDGHSNYTKIWKDLSGNYDGIIGGSASFNNKGCINLNSDKWINIGQMPEDIYNTVTMEVSVIFDEIQNGEVDLLSNIEAGGYALVIIDGRPEFQAYLNGHIETLKFDEKLLPNRLYNLTGTFDGETLSLYIDGALRCTKKISSKTTVKAPNNNTVMAIGTNPNGDNASGNFMKGSVYSVRIYQSVLTENEIRKNMNADRITNNTDFSDNFDKVSITINFSEPVSNFNTDDIIIKNGKKGELKKSIDKQYILDITDIVASSNLEISIADGSFTDLTGNNGIGAKIERYRDATGPTATITANTEDIAETKNILYTISFNEQITGFNIDDIIVKNGNKSDFKEVDERKVYTILVSNNKEKTQEITIPEGSVYDSCGNSNLKIVKQFKVEDESENLEINVEVNEIVEENGIKYIENIKPNTTISSLKKNIKTNGKIEVYKESSIIIDENQFIGTGMNVVIKLNEQEEKYISIVTGDLTGNGEMENLDLLKLARYVANIDKTLNKEYLKASDILKDGKYGDNLDILKMARILVGLEQL